MSDWSRSKLSPWQKSQKGHSKQTQSTTYEHQIVLASCENNNPRVSTISYRSNGTTKYNKQVDAIGRLADDSIPKTRVINACVSRRRPIGRKLLGAGFFHQTQQFSKHFRQTYTLITAITHTLSLSLVISLALTPRLTPKCSAHVVS